MVVETEDTAEGNGDDAAADDSAEHRAAPPGAENLLSARDSSNGAVSPTANKTKMVGPTDFKAMKADRASRIAARTSALSSGEGGGGDKRHAPAAGERGEGEAAPSPPLGEATNTSNKVAPRSKIPTVRRTSRRTRGAV